MSTYIKAILLFAVIFWDPENLFSHSDHQHDIGQKGFLFVENDGQWAEEVQYRAEIPGGFLFVHQEGFTLVFYHPDDMSKLHDEPHKSFPINGRAIKYHFPEMDENPEIEASNPANTKFNYYTDDDPDHFVTGKKGYQELTIKEIQEGVDLILYSQNNRLKYDLLLREGVEAADISYDIKGADSLYLKNDRLHVEAGFASFSEGPPVIFEGFYPNDEKQIEGRYHLEDNTLSYRLKNPQDNEGAILIDPELIFSTYSGSRADNFGFTATYDHQKNGYTAGIVFASGFPATAGAFQEQYEGFVDGFSFFNVGILKFTPDGSDLLYATYLGGADGNERPHSLVVNEDDELVVMGNTTSEDFPTTSNAYNPDINSETQEVVTNGDTSEVMTSDIFVTVLSPEGDELTGSTFLGGISWDGRNGRNPYDHFDVRPVGYNYGDVFRGEVIVDSLNRIYLTTSSRSEDFPITEDFFLEERPIGSQNAVLARLSPDVQSLQWAGLLGGEGADGGFGITRHSSGDLFVTGGTTSGEFPGTGEGLISDYPGGEASGFVSRISPDGDENPVSTYLGTDDFNLAFLSSEGPEGNMYFAGQTTGHYPKDEEVYGQPGSGQFIEKISPDLGSREWSTTFGTGDEKPDISPSAFMVDECGRIYYTGWGGATNQGGNVERGGLPEAGDLFDLPLTEGAIQPDTIGSGFYVAVFSPQMQDLIYGSVLGSALSDDHVDGGTSRFNEEGHIYQAVCAGCNGGSDFPTSDDAWSTDNLGERVGSDVTGCNNLLFRMSFDLESEFSYEKSVCEREVAFKPPEGAFYGFEWDFGDGNTSTEEAPTHQFPEHEAYEVKLIMNPGTGCADTSYQEIDLTISPFEEVDIPNAFSPTGDDINDLYVIAAMETFCYNYEFKVFNRWGEKVFEEINEPEEPLKWDGKTGGDALEPGTYYYIFRSGEEVETGTISIFR